MRRLVWMTLGFGLGCGLCAYLLPIRWVAILGICVLLLGLLSLGRSRGKLSVRTVLLLGFSAGCLWFYGFYWACLNEAVQMDTKVIQVTVRARDYGQDTDYGSAVEGTVTLEGKDYQVKAYLKEKQEILPGDRLTGSFRFRVTTPGGSREASRYEGRGTFLLLYQTGEIILAPGNEKTWTDRAAEFRRNLKGILDTCFPEDTAPFAKALLLGDTGELSYAEDTNLKVSGIRHVAAVSGLHVSILFALVGVLTLRRRFLTVLVGFPVLFAFWAVAGFTPSVTRACLMCGLMLLALLFEKGYDGATALAFASLVMLLRNPLVITDGGFQLSVGSVAGIFLFSGRIDNWMRKRFFREKGKSWRGKVIRWACASVSVTLGAQIFTVPLCAMYFDMVSLIGIVTNLLTLWIIGGIFYGLLALCLIYSAFPSVGLLLARGIAWPIRYVQWIARLLANTPLSAVYTKSPYVTAWLIFLYLLLAVFLFQRNRKPRVLACCALMGLCAVLLLSWIEPLGEDVRFTVLDVGQGQCLLFQKDGHTFLVDCGGDGDDASADTAAEALLSQGIRKLDGVILTHCDRDHVGGVDNLLSRVDTDLLILPDRWSEWDFSTKGRVLYAQENLELTFGTGKIRIYPANFPGTDNENSLCVLFDTENCDILITGDRDGFGERTLVRNEAISKVDVLVAGHHGSKNSTCQELLTAVQPEIVCISVGKDNSFGHPAPETLKRLEENGCKVYRTDESGDILIRR